jgi:hypothetical protein
MHDTLGRVGDLVGVHLYATGVLPVRGYALTFDEDEEVVEDELVALGFRRNPIACYKSLPDGRPSEGSWVLLNRDNPVYIARGMQLHVTMFARSDGKPGREMYAHYEDDWRVSPLPHLRAENFSESIGVEMLTELIDEQSYLVRK